MRIAETETEALKPYRDRDDLVFAFLDPYSVHVASEREFVDALSQAGFSVLDARYLIFCRSMIELVYAENQPIGPAKSWAQPGEVYLNEASIAYILQFNSRACETLRRLKGKTEPSTGLRAMLGAPTTALSMMHSSDNTEAMLSEALAAFTLYEVQRAFDALEPTVRSQRRAQTVGPAWKPQPQEFLSEVLGRVADEIEVAVPEVSAALHTELTGLPDQPREWPIDRIARLVSRDLTRAAQQPLGTSRLYSYYVPLEALCRFVTLLAHPQEYRFANVEWIDELPCALVRNRYEAVLLRSILQEWHPKRV